jgi:hypothetical protein
MKTKILNVLLALGCAASIAAISSQAQAHHGCCGTTSAYVGNGYYHYSGHYPYGKSGYVQGRPVKYVDGDYYFVQHCNKGHYYHHHHKWHRPCCS